MNTGNCDIHPLRLCDLIIGDPEDLSAAGRIISNTRPHDSGCLEWLRAKDRDGYGITYYRKHQWRVPRLVFHLWKDPIPDRFMVLHRCDNPSCCNPDHLFIGNAKTNRMDCVSKGRATVPCGENHYTSKLTKEQVLHILWNYQWRTPGRMAPDFAREFGVSVGAIWGVIYGKTWKHLRTPRQVIENNRE